MKLIFAGTPDFAARALNALLEARHEVVLVLTRPDKPSGRGMNTQASPVKKLALDHGLAIHQPRTLKDPLEQEPLRAAAPDILVVAAYGLILPQSVLDIPKRGAINIHASLLPRWRGAAPIQRALLGGDAITGVSIMQMDAGLDTGPVLLTEQTPITSEDTAGSLYERLAGIGASLVVEALRHMEHGALEPKPQEESLACYARKLEKSEARIDWRREAGFVDRQIRAFNPVPGCSARIRSTELKIWRAAIAPRERGAPGEVVQTDETGVVVACGQGALRLIELQRPGGRKLAAADFLRGFPVRPGECFEL